MHLFFSNRLDTLYRLFSKEYQKKKPFEKHWVLSPSFATQSYIKKKTAQDLGILMGINFMFLQPGIKSILSFFYSELHLESPQDLALRIDQAISKLSNNFEKMPFNEQKLFEPLLKYLHDAESKTSSGVRRQTALSDALASLWIEYGLYAPSLAADWNQPSSIHWQQALWKMLSERPSFLMDPHTLLNQRAAEKVPGVNLYLFGFNHIPKLYLNVLYELSPYMNIYLFQMAPCRLFWTDTKNPFEKTALISHLKKKGASKPELDQLSYYLSDTNPLLSSFGKLGREFQKTLEDLPIPLEEHYTLPIQGKSFSEYQDCYEGFENEEVNEEMSLLKHVQMDLLSMRKPKNTLPLEKDSSIQLHEASSYKREIEVLHENLVLLFEENKDLSLSDVVVLVPEIEKYIPYIEETFKTSSSPFDYVLHDAPFSLKNQALRGFFLILDLLNSRWDKESVFDLLDHPLIRKKFNLKAEEVQLWKSWADEIGLQWGIDEEHQRQVLLQSYEETFENEKVFKNWDQFFGSCIEKLVLNKNEDLFSRSLNQIDFSDATSFQNLLGIFQSLKEDLLPMQHAQSQATFAEWASYTIAIIQTYLGDEYEQNGEIRALLKRVEGISNISPSLEEELFPFETFLYYLKKDLSLFHTEVYSQQVEALSFFSLYSKPVLPSKITYVLGLSEEYFPRNPKDSPLSLFKNFSEKDFCPKTIDLDRYQFLEIITNTQDRLYLSYQNYSLSTHKKQLPSIVLTELLSYIDRAYLIDGQKPSTMLLTKHPHLSFNFKAFTKKNFYKDSYPLAQSYYQSQKQKAISKFSESMTDPLSLSSKLDLLQKHKVLNFKDLSSFMRDPLQFYLNKQHQIYLKEDKWDNPDQQFVLSNLQQAMMRKRIFNADEPINLAETENAPIGLFKDVMEDHLNEDLAQIQRVISGLGLKEEELFSLEFREDVVEPIPFKKNHWLIPSLPVPLNDQNSIELVGLIENVSSKGLLSFSKFSIENALSLWPSLLALLCSPHLHLALETDFNSALHFLRSSKTFEICIQNPLEELANHVKYYLMGQEEPLPFLPVWVPNLVRNSSEELRDKIIKDLNSSFFNSTYAKEVLNLDILENKKRLEVWKNLSGHFFSNLLSSFKF